MRYLAILCIISALMFACKKDRLVDGKSIFIGTWNWVQSEHTYGICTGDPPIEEIITPDSEGSNYSMEFLEKGIVKFYENQSQLEKKRLVFAGFGESCFEDDYVSFDTYLNNNQEDITQYFYGCISTDTLIVIKGFPHVPDPEGCETHVSYFVRQ